MQPRFDWANRPKRVTSPVVMPRPGRRARIASHTAVAMHEDTLGVLAPRVSYSPALRLLQRFGGDRERHFLIA